MKISFIYTGMPNCCLAGIISSFNISNEKNDLTKNDLKLLCEQKEINVIYATDYSDSIYVPILLELEFNIIDVNFNNNSGNTVYLMKYLYEK